MKKLLLTFLIIFSTFSSSNCVLKDITVDLCKALADFDFDKFELEADSFDNPDLYKDMIFNREFEEFCLIGFFNEFSLEDRLKFVTIFQNKKLSQIKNFIVKHYFLKKSFNKERGLFLRDAIMKKRIKTIKILSESGIEINLIKIFPNDPNKYWYPLHYAAMYNVIEVAKFLISKTKYDFWEVFFVDVKDNCGNTPLHFAAMRGHIEIAELLLENNADVFAVNQLEETPLDKAKQCGKANMIKLLEEAETFESMWLMFEGAEFDDESDYDTDVISSDESDSDEICFD